MNEAVIPPSLAWRRWQCEVLRLLRSELDELEHIGAEDIDWISWHCYYAQGKSPRQAIERALERDI